MTQTPLKIDKPRAFPDHTQLPDEDGTFRQNFQEHPQSIILTDSIGPVLQTVHPEGDYCIGQDCGIYWRETDPPRSKFFVGGAIAPDWFYVGNVPALLDGQIRRSYVLWRELMAPLIVLEFASGDGAEERDKTPLSLSNTETVTNPGKFWVYERIIRVPYYGIYEIKTGRLEVYHLRDLTYQKLAPNDRGHYPISPLGIELGLWQGSYQNQEQLWLRWWDNEGNLLLTGHERADLAEYRAEQEKQRAEQEKQRAELAEQKAAKLAERLREMGIDPDMV